MDITDLRWIKPPDQMDRCLRKALTPLLIPLSAVYGGVARLRRAVPARRTDVRIPVVSVGSLAVGGTGKTPVSMWVAERFSGLGRRVCILSRGFRRRKGPSPLVVTDGRRILADVREAGDEPYMMARHLDLVGVIVGKNRMTSAVKARESLNADLLVLDDGFQERRIRHSVDILCFDVESLRTRNSPLPSGSLREGWSAIGRENLIAVCLDRPDSPPPEDDLNLLGTARVFYYVHAEPRILGTDLSPVDRHDIDRHSFVLVSGVGKPAAFENACERSGVAAAASIRFQDHHWYTDRDAETIRTFMKKHAADRVLTTEKDIWKFPEDLAEISLILQTEIVFLDPEAFMDVLRAKVGETR